MNILLIIHHKLDVNSGASGTTIQLGKCYQMLGHNVQYYSLDNLPKILSDLHRYILFPLFVAVHIHHLLKQQKIDVIDASTGDTWIWGMFFKALNRSAPLLVTRSHGLEHIAYLHRLEEHRRGYLKLSWKYFLYRGKFRLWEILRSLKLADLIFFLNQRDAEYGIKVLGLNPEIIYVFPNGITDVFINQPIDLTLNRYSTIGITQIGTYIPRKGICYSVPALISILKHYPQVKVRFLGTMCPEHQVYADFPDDLQNRIEVISTYNYNHLPQLLKGYQITLLASLSEGFGKTLVEAMACGLAPVATQTHGPSSIITDQQDGLLIPIRDQKAIETALETLILDHKYLEKIRSNAYKTAQSYRWEFMAQKRLKAYETALNSRR